MYVCTKVAQCEKGYIKTKLKLMLNHEHGCKFEEKKNRNSHCTDTRIVTHIVQMRD